MAEERYCGGQVPKRINVISYIPEYKNRQVVITTERFDNGSMRVIFGNDVAINAIKTNQTPSWPKGTIFAKAAWEEIEDKNGEVRTGQFKQVEYMIKDEQLYRSTLG